MSANNDLDRVPMFLNRRQFLALSAGAAAGAALTGCATNPVSGKSQFMLMSESGEINIDREQSPHQFSADYGPSQDRLLNNYVSQVGLEMSQKTHRPHMPYTFRVVNSPRYNAYTFPGGSMAVTRGILLGMDNEAELAAVLGHELGHVNARHGAERMSKSILANMVVAGLAVGMSSAKELEDYAPLAAGLGNVAAGALLASYSREDEREADALGLEYMVKQGLNPRGMVGLMDVMRKQGRQNANVIELMFATHPMSEERYQTAKNKVSGEYAQYAQLPVNRERFMDSTAQLRTLGNAILAMQKGDAAMATGRYQEALQHYSGALQAAPNDYAGLLLMANCCQALDRSADAKQYAEQAKAVYPQEAQAYFATGMADLNLGNFGAAHANFATYQGKLPGNPNVIFWDAFSQENMGQTDAAANQYAQYLNSVQQGNLAQHAYQRLVEWGYLAKPTTP